ncbi:Carbonic anhydrase or acetyltransferase, isoleucine patch superfamily [Jannaschia faecimaris]|uniref:Carbonic anhydrase or acetyltransferase, isoleucine patch superfamily n=1 Tax=Jannaschia faecimaris TaxID=1244108 RepID=A0A1H3NVI0_9RHOB|nr:gamma carbonic anhydrase family protein [Jannaschia faecimaris]SDY92720.1 Carbonic anhydrase or acetyltransferase, isoleucine patch superfamily [Jannaschia faecimaris]
MIYELDGVCPTVDETAWVAPDANIIGDVTLAAGSSIWFGTTIRGDNDPIAIGANSNVQENCVLHTDVGFPLTVGANVTVGHKATLHGCTIADGALIGMGATVLNGAVIGEGCLIGAGALITEGKVIPPGSLVMGAPGKVVRQLDQAALDELLASAEHYRQNAARFAKGLRAV